jgi:hypothetical protein
MVCFMTLPFQFIRLKNGKCFQIVKASWEKGHPVPGGDGFIRGRRVGQPPSSDRSTGTLKQDMITRQPQ